jgi:hypothetical protein
MTIDRRRFLGSTMATMAAGALSKRAVGGAVCDAPAIRVALIGVRSQGWNH